MTPYLISIAMTLGPALSGVGLASYLRGRPAPATLAGAAVLTTGIALTWMMPSWSLWDADLALACFAIGALVAYAPPTRRTATQAGLGLLLTVGVSECTARIMLPYQAPLGQAEDVTLGASARRLYRDTCVFNAPLRDRPYRVLHLGDSMVDGYGLPASVPRFTDRLAEFQPNVDHVNMGEKATATDCQLLMLHDVPDDVAVDEVIVYVFAGNDLTEVGHAVQSYGEPPLLVEGPDGLIPNPTVATSRNMLGRAVHDAPPFALRLASVHSQLATHLLARWYQFTYDLRDRAKVTDPVIARQQAAYMSRVLDAMQAEAHRRGARLRIVLVPMRGHDPAAPRVEFLALDAMLSDRTPSAISMVNVVARWERTPIDDEVFLNTTDFHFGRVGHERWADWMLQTLWPPAELP